MVRKTLFSLMMVGSFAAPFAFAEGTDAGATGTGGMGTGSTTEECITEEQKQSQYCQDLMRNQGGSSTGTDSSGMGTGTGTGTDSGSGSTGSGTGTDSTMPESTTSPTTP